MADQVKRIEDLGNDDQVVAFKAYQGLLIAVTRAGAPGKDSERAKLAGSLAQELNATKPGGKDNKGKAKPAVIKHSARIRNLVARLLSYVGGENEVETLVKALDDLEVREMARFRAGSQYGLRSNQGVGRCGGPDRPAVSDWGD